MSSTQQKIIKNKVGLLRLAEELGNVSRACKVMGYSRDTFYSYKQAVDEGGFEALVEKSRRKPNLKNRTAPETEAAILVSGSAFPSFLQVGAVAILAGMGSGRRCRAGRVGVGLEPAAGQEVLGGPDSERSRLRGDRAARRGRELLEIELLDHVVCT